jgi:hypothetical protein
MRSRFTVSVFAPLLIATLASAATNLNSSRSNIYRLTYPTDLVSSDQAKAILAELDRMGPADEAKLKQWLAANFKRLGIAPDRVKKMVVLPRSREMKEIAIILLTKPEDEAAARATTVKSSKSNTSD